MGYNEKYYKRHLDQYRLWQNNVGKSIVENFEANSILDLGCGVGSYLEGAKQSGCSDIMGIELNYDKAKNYMVDEVKNNIKKGDITSNLNIDKQFDCCISFEVAEHIVPEGTEGFVKNLTEHSKKYIILSAAPPGQPGTGHINLKPQHFWIDKIQENNFLYKASLISEYKKIWQELEETPGNKYKNWVLRNLMIFERKK